MKTVIAMVTIGPDSWTRKYSVARAKAYAARHGYEFAQITKSSQPGSGRTPHWEKVLVPRTLPGYDRYLIIDDDVLLNTRIAPALPAVPAGALGIVREPVPTVYPLPMRWMGNSGVLLFDRSCAGLMQDAYELGEVTDIEPGYGDQPALNRVAWAQGRVKRLPWRWNFIFMADWLHTVHRQHHPWTQNRQLAQFAKLTMFSALTFAMLRRALGGNPRGSGTLRRMRESYALHLISFRMGAWLVDRYLG